MDTLVKEPVTDLVTESVATESDVGGSRSRFARKPECAAPSAAPARRGRPRHEALYPDAGLFLGQGRLVTESLSVLVSTPPGLVRPMMCAALGRSSTDERSSGADGSVHLGPVGSDAIEPAADPKSRHSGASLLGARGVRTHDLVLGAQGADPRFV
jgi:hypothetical protein